MHPTPQPLHEPTAGKESPISIAQADAAAVHGTAPEIEVGEILRRMDASRALTGEELEQHIRDCEALWKRSYALFRAHHNPADRDEALLWLHRQNEAILMRAPAVQAQRHAQFEQRLAAGVERLLPASPLRSAK